MADRPKKIPVFVANNEGKVIDVYLRDRTEEDDNPVDIRDYVERSEPQKIIDRVRVSGKQNR